MPKKKELFTITEDHLKLLRHTNFEWNNQMYDGAPCVDIKRPYGNSGGVQYDIGEILNLPINPKYPENDWEDKYTGEQAKYCLKLHREMEQVFQITCSTGQVSVGTYSREGVAVFDDTAWKKDSR